MAHVHAHTCHFISLSSRLVCCFWSSLASCTPVYFCFVCVCVYSQSFVCRLANRPGKILLTPSVSRNCNVTVKRKDLCWLTETYCCAISHSLCLYFYLSLSYTGKRNRAVKNRNGSGIAMTSWPPPSVAKQGLLWDVLMPRYCMFIKRSHCYKQENAIGFVENGAETQVPLRQWTGAHFSTVSQWDRRKHMAAE